MEDSSWCCGAIGSVQQLVESEGKSASSDKGWKIDR